MPREEVKTEIVYKQIFMDVLKEKGVSIRKLGSDDVLEVQSTERTIRRQLNKGRMRPKLLDEIARYLNVDARVLSGELIIQTHFSNTYPLRHLDEYPYKRQEYDALRKEQYKETIVRVLSIYNRTYDQFMQLRHEDKVSFLKELLDASYPIVTKYLETQAFRSVDECEDQLPFIALDFYDEKYYAERYAEEDLRPKFLKNPPEGYSRLEIEKMSADEMLYLDAVLQTEVYKK